MNIVDEIRSLSKDELRAKLIDVCEKSIVNVGQWMNRDSPDSQCKVGTLWALLKAGCEFDVNLPKMDGDSLCVTDERTIWVEVTYPGFGYFDHGGPKEVDNFYLPTPDRLKERENSDWY